MWRYLLVANKTLGGVELMDVVRERLAAEPCHFHVLVPATDPRGAYQTSVAARPRSAIRRHNAVENARQRLEHQLAMLRDVGAQADGEVGPPDPLEAISAVLARNYVDEIILSTLPAAVSHWVHTGLPHRVASDFSLPVTHVEAGRTPVYFQSAHSPSIAKSPTRRPAPRRERDRANEVATRLDDLDRHIQRARRDVARFRHEGERHFIDQGSTGIYRALQTSDRCLDELVKSWQDIERRIDDEDVSPSTVDSHTRLLQLQRGIDQVRVAVAQFHHQNERHFID